MACFVLTISLAFDTFLQATISLAGSIERTTDLYTVPSIGRSTHVGVGSLLQFINPGEFRVAEENYTMETDIFIAYPSMGLLSAIFNGLDNSSAGQQDKVGFSCKTGNCTWPVFASAAVCGSCNDVSKHIFKSSGYGHQSSQPPMDAVIIDGNYTSFNVSYSSIKNANGRRSSPFNPQTSTGDQTDAILTVNATTDYLQSLTYQDANTTFLTFLIMEVDPNWANASVAWEDSTVKATECGLSLCVNAYNSSAQNGSLIEEKVASWHNREPDSWRLTDGYDATYEWWDETYPSLSNEFSLFRSDLQLSIPPNLTQGLNINTTERFNVTQGTIASIQSWILTWGFGAPQSGDIAGLPNLIVYPINADNPYTLAEVLYDSNDLNATFAGLSSSITSYIRDSSSTTVPGDTHEYVIRFRVRWAFFAVPALHILGGITYVFAILWQTKDSGLPVWKNSLIPSLAYGLDTAAQDILRSPHGHLDLASEAVRSKMMVAFDTRDVRLQLRLSEPAGYDGK